MRPTTHCVTCQTPISVGEPTCWACGVVQARPAPPVFPAAPPAGVPYHRPCPRCRHAIAVYHPQCKNCGYVLGRSNNTPPAELPSGWEATLLPDGSIQLKRTTWNRLNHSGQFSGSVLALIMLLSIQLAPGRHRPVPAEFAWLSQLPFLFLTVFVVGYLIWMLLGTEQWQVGPGLVDVRKECLGRRWGPRITQCELLLRAEWRSSGRHRHQVCRLIARDWGKEHVLAETRMSGAVQLQLLGSYLSGQTGWPLQIPQEWPPVSLWSWFG